MSDQLFDEEAMKHFREKLRRHEQTRDDSRRLQQEVGIKSIEAIRKWTFEVLTISSAILGVFIAIGSNSPMVEHKAILPYAFLLFVLTITIGFYRLKKHMEEDLNKFPSTMDKYIQSQTNIINAERKFNIKKTKEAFDNMQHVNEKELENIKFQETKEKRSYDFDLVFYMFFIGLTLIGYSIRYRFGGIMTILLVYFLSKFAWEEFDYYKKMRNLTK